MKISNGIDIIEIERIAKSMNSKSFMDKVFSKKEQELFQRKNFSAQTVSANFCAKEAFAKALGTGIRNFKLNEVSVLRDDSGAPYLELEGNAKKIADGFSFSVSLTHNDTTAAAVVTAYR